MILYGNAGIHDCFNCRTFIEDSGAGIKISPQDNNFPGFHDRLVTVAGTLGEQIRAIELILYKLAEDSSYMQSMNAPFPYSGMDFLFGLNLQFLDLSAILWLDKEVLLNSV